MHQRVSVGLFLDDRVVFFGFGLPEPFFHYKKVFFLGVLQV